jgi:NADPH:quinone reductase-like Zn-dependent oxidoreductase
MPSLPEGQPMVALRTGRLSGAIGAGAAAVATSTAPRNVVLERPSYGAVAEAEEDEDLVEDSKEIDESGLAAFADQVGAKSMAEMLEAAAAYATCVEKRSQFTRPQLMRRMVASAGGKPVSREDGLRSFGTLLRTGRIEKVTRGHYTLADNSPYLAEARRLT